MKTRSKVLSLVLAGTLVVSAGMFGTLAYLTDEDTVTNTFTVGNVQITLDEADVDDSTPDADRDQENSYKLLPGKTYKKDPIVHVNSESEDSYLFVKVENEITDIEGGTTVAQQMDNKGWDSVSGTDGIYVYVGDGTDPVVVKGGDNVTVFDNFTIAAKTTNETLANYSGKTITVTAYAIQADGFEGETAQDIWEAGFGTDTATE